MSRDALQIEIGLEDEILRLDGLRRRHLLLLPSLLPIIRATKHAADECSEYDISDESQRNDGQHCVSPERRDTARRSRAD
jgi:hypothetical protein